MTLRHRQLPIWRDANRLMVDVEWVVRRFPCCHRYTVDSDPRRQAMEACRAGLPWVQVAEDGWLKGGIKRRVMRALSNREAGS